MRTWLNLWSLILGAGSPAQPLPPGAPQLEIQPWEVGQNLLPNSSFEVIDGNRPKFWAWDRRNTDATLTLDSTVARSGRISLKFTNGTPFGPHVYGLFSLVGGVATKPHTAYTVSAYVRSDDPGLAWIGGAGGWRVRASFPRTHGHWVRVSQTFVTEAGETNIPLLIVTETPTEGFWVDDVKLEEGSEATPYLPEGEAARPHLELAVAPWPSGPSWKPSLYPPQQVAFLGRELRAEGFLFLPQARPEATLRVTFADPQGRTLAEVADRRDLPAGAHRLRFGWGLPPSLFEREEEFVLRGRLQAVLTAADGQEVASSTIPVEAIPQAGVEKQLAAVETLRQRLRERLHALAEEGRDPAYPQVTAAVLEDFLPYAREDLEHQEIGRAWDAALVLEQMARQALASDWTPSVPRYVTGPRRIEGPSFRGRMENGKWRMEDRPIFFVGYGHFGAVRRDIEKFPAYGVNLIQIEFGPNSVLVGENEIDNRAVEDFLAVCDRAARAGVSVNLLLSPHYFPAWALQKWPHLADCSGGFLGYCVHAPESRSVLERFLRHVIPQIRDHPALHSLCLSNEPINVDLSQCAEARSLWQAWLRQRHGDLAALNRKWGTHFQAFDEIRVPEPQFDPTPQVYDFVCFNQETFAGWHRWMADVIHEMAPAVPVHAKIMMGAHFSRNLAGIWSVDPELFGALSQINGNDAVRWPAGSGEWASDWQLEMMGYDFQRSVVDRPVFNSENHLIPDRYTDVVRPEYIQNVLWQGAVHGQSATTLWVWERTFDPRSDFAGSIMHRPDCAAAVGTTCHDLNRLALEVTALQRLEPKVVLLWSLASTVYGGPHEGVLWQAYAALDFTGVPLGFVTERQLAEVAEGRWRIENGEWIGREGQEAPPGLRSPQVIVVPAVTHTPETTLIALRRMEAAGVKVIRLGECFGRTEYQVPRDAADLPGRDWEPGALGGDKLWLAFDSALEAWGVKRPIRLQTPDGQPVWGVEMRAAVVPGGGDGKSKMENGGKGEAGEGGDRPGRRWVVNLSNYLREPRRVQLLRDGQPVRGRDLLNGEALGETFEVASLVPRLVELL
jgi:hypothetical protein